MNSSQQFLARLNSFGVIYDSPERRSFSPQRSQREFKDIKDSPEKR
jgi:hypothetical protein